jgi:hypothetical protein
MRILVPVGFVSVFVLALALNTRYCCQASVTEEELKNWPLPCYQGEKLNELRNWERTWAGQRINQDSIDQVKAFLSEEYYQVYKNPENWGADELWFSIIPYEQVLPTPGQIAATRKYAPHARLDNAPRKAYWKGGIGPDEFLSGWDTGETAGFPFPFPASGLEIAWNLDSVTHGDTKSYKRESALINTRTRVEKQTIENKTVDYFTGRLDVPPLPLKPGNNKGIRKGILSLLVEPADIKGLMMMELLYLDVGKPEDLWSWVAMFRRLRRLGITWKLDTLHGTEMLPDDENGWNSHINVKNWKLVGRREMLLGRHVDVSKYSRKNGQVVWSGQQLERINAFVVEAHYKDPNSSYSKEILYIDPEMWRCLQKVAWDRQGVLWRQFFYHTEMVKSVQGIIQPHCVELHSIDMQKKRGNPGKDRVIEIGLPIPDNFWTVQQMQKMGY